MEKGPKTSDYQWYCQFMNLSKLAPEPQFAKTTLHFRISLAKNIHLTEYESVRPFKSY